MPATTPKPKDAAEKAKENGSDRAAVKFVVCDLTTGMKNDLKSWRDDTPFEEVWKHVEQAIEQGVVLSIRANETGYQCSGTGTRSSGLHFGQCLVARASTPQNAVYAWDYKDRMILKQVWPDTGRHEELDL